MSAPLSSSLIQAKEDALLEIASTSYLDVEQEDLISLCRSHGKQNFHATLDQFFEKMLKTGIHHVLETSLSTDQQPVDAKNWETIEAEYKENITLEPYVNQFLMKALSGYNNDERGVTVFQEDMREAMVALTTNIDLQVIKLFDPKGAQKVEGMMTELDAQHSAMLREQGYTQR